MQLSQTSFNQAVATAADMPPEVTSLVSEGHLDIHDVVAAQDIARQNAVALSDVLVSDFAIPEAALLQAQADTQNIAVIDPEAQRGDPALLARFGPQKALHHLVLPWRQIGETTVVLTSRPHEFHTHLSSLSATFGPVRMALATSHQIRAAIQTPYASVLASAAEHKVSEQDSCRHWRQDLALVALLVLAVGLTAGIAFTPTALFTALTLWTVTLLGLQSALILAALIAVQRLPAYHPVQRMSDTLPSITILIPLYKESALADHLLKRLTDIDYPRSLLDVCLVMESDDMATRDQLSQLDLPPWIRSITVPRAALRTKPRALNYALDTARGSIVGIYDAEDAPERSQLRVVAQKFAEAGADTACLQGRLDYYNPAANWLTRCFTIEYAAWFRVVLPGLARLGLVVPLGGTTLFFRRSILEKLGGWDAHNVTEDADLGLRLARRGFRTEFIPTVTEEEANGRAWPWVRQRARWLKGYAMTYAVHMRNPRHLLRDLGLWKFFGVQLLFLGTLTQFLLAPLLWSFWLIPFGGTHPLSTLTAEWVVFVCTGICIFSAAVNFTAFAKGVIAAQKRWLLPWIITTVAYFPLGTLAVYKGLIELTWRPFFWDKTMHGLLMPTMGVIRPLRPRRHQA